MPDLTGLHLLFFIGRVDHGDSGIPYKMYTQGTIWPPQVSKFKNMFKYVKFGIKFVHGSSGANNQLRQIHTMLSFQDIEQNMSTVNELSKYYTGVEFSKYPDFMKLKMVSNCSV